MQLNMFWTLYPVAKYNILFKYTSGKYLAKLATYWVIARSLHKFQIIEIIQIMFSNSETQLEINNKNN